MYIYIYIHTHTYRPPLHNECVSLHNVHASACTCMHMHTCACVHVCRVCMCVFSYSCVSIRRIPQKNSKIWGEHDVHDPQIARSLWFKKSVKKDGLFSKKT